MKIILQIIGGIILSGALFLSVLLLIGSLMAIWRQLKALLKFTAGNEKIDLWYLHPGWHIDLSRQTRFVRVMVSALGGIAFLLLYAMWQEEKADGRRKILTKKLVEYP